MPIFHKKPRDEFTLKGFSESPAVQLSYHRIISCYNKKIMLIGCPELEKDEGRDMETILRTLMRIPLLNRLPESVLWDISGLN